MGAKIDTANGYPHDQHVGASYQSPETVTEWVRRWADNLEGAIGCGFYLDGVDTLCTTWPIAAAPGTRTKCTQRGTGQSDQDFIDAHGEEVLADMAGQGAAPNPS